MFKNHNLISMSLSSISCCMLIGCASVSTPQSKEQNFETSTNGLSNSPQYNQSVKDAKKVEVWEVSKGLSSVTVDNPDLKWKLIDGEKYILVSSWKAETNYYKPQQGSIFYNTGAYPIWVTLAPQLKNICSKQEFSADVGLENRLIQILGLHPDSQYKSFVEFWVKPRDLFRPCPDAEITDNQCDLFFPRKTKPAHRKWIENQRATNDYPWTQLGYTYDWNKDAGAHIGLSEFVINQDADVVVAGITETKNYCSPS